MTGVYAVPIIISLAFLFLIFLILREVWCWYWKINERSATLLRIADGLDALNKNLSRFAVDTAKKEADDILNAPAETFRVVPITDEELRRIQKREGKDVRGYAYREGNTWTCICGTRNLFDKQNEFQLCMACERNRERVLDAFGAPGD